MLKLEKLSKSQDVQITIWQREKFFNKRLCQSLALALALHASFILFFQVTPFVILGSQTLIAPALVESSMDISEETVVVAGPVQEELFRSSLKEPKSSNSELPEVAVSKVFVHVPEDSVYKAPPSRFLKSSPNDLEFLFNTPSKKVNSFTISVRGKLADREMKTVSFPTLTNNFKNYRTHFAVQVDDQTGEIFWVEPKHKEEVKEVEIVALELLKQLRFEKLENSFVTAGEVEIEFRK